MYCSSCDNYMVLFEDLTPDLLLDKYSSVL
jgi:hypothetical protein